jgi:hypothetical protein
MEKQTSKGEAEVRTAIYCRVSTEGQEQDGTSLQTQLENPVGRIARLGSMKPDID